MIPEYIFGALNFLLIALGLYFLFKSVRLFFRIFDSTYGFRTYREVRKLRIDLQRLIKALENKKEEPK